MQQQQNKVELNCIVYKKKNGVKNFIKILHFFTLTYKVRLGGTTDTTWGAQVTSTNQLGCF